MESGISYLIGIDIGMTVAKTLVISETGDVCASGIVRNGLVSATIGTSGVVFAHTDD